MRLINIFLMEPQGQKLSLIPCINYIKKVRVTMTEKKERKKADVQSQKLGRLQGSLAMLFEIIFSSFEVSSLEMLSCADCEILCDHILIRSLLA